MLRDLKHAGADDSPGAQARSLDVAKVERMRALMHSIIGILVEDCAAGAQRGDALPPCYETMLRQEVVIELPPCYETMLRQEVVIELPPCYETMLRQEVVIELREAVAYIAEPEVQILIVHHLSDLLLFPILELLRQLEDSLTHTVNCAAFFFVDRNDLTFAERVPTSEALRREASRQGGREDRGAPAPHNGCGKWHGRSVFVLFEFALPYLRRTDVCKAEDVVVSKLDLPEAKDRARRLHTAD
eukprot:gene54033-31446_t